jgi:TPR repeat protein
VLINDSAEQLFRDGDLSKKQRNYQQAASFYQMAADQGHADAQYNLGLCYGNGKGVPKDVQQALKYIQMAADQGCAKAAHDLGACFANGEGVAKDEQQATKYFQMAADKGNEDQFFLGLCYASGRLGVTKDALLAVKYNNGF